MVRIYVIILGQNGKDGEAKRDSEKKFSKALDDYKKYQDNPDDAIHARAVAQAQSMNRRTSK